MPTIFYISDSFILVFHFHTSAKVVRVASSNYTELQAESQLADSSPLRLSIGIPITFKDYIAKEWLGNTDVAERVRRGYLSLEELGFTHLMVVRGDNYCAIRSNLFQAFTVENLTHCPLLGNMGSIDEVQKCVEPMFVKYPFLKKWSFANKGEFHREGSTVDVLKLCIANLAYEVNEVRLKNRFERIHYFYDKLNANPSKIFDFSLMEAVKFYMFVKSAEFWEISQKGGVLPQGMEYFFLRETALSLEDFLCNHLNNVGNIGGLEMIEMFLLGYTLGLQICVHRISSYGMEDFTSHFPPGDYPKEKIIAISAEDDRHYNVVTNLNYKEEFILSSTVFDRLF